MQEIKQIHIGNIIKNHLEKNGQKISWLANQLEFDRRNFYKVLEKKYIHTDLLYRISKVLDCDFFVHFSNHLKFEKK